MSNINISDTNSFKTWLDQVQEADRLKAAQFVCGVWVAGALPIIMSEFEAQLSQGQAKISKTLQRLLVSLFHGMSVYNMQLDENSNSKKDLIGRYKISETVVFDESWFDEIDLRAGNLTRCKDAVQNYISLINNPDGVNMVKVAVNCVIACTSLFKGLANGSSRSPWDTISRSLKSLAENDVSTWATDTTIASLYCLMGRSIFGSSNEGGSGSFDHGFEFWHRLLGIFSTYDDDNKFEWAALWAAFGQQAEYINNRAEIETTNKLLECSYDLYKARLWVLDSDSKNQTQREEVKSSWLEIANLKAENETSQHVIVELQAKLKEKTATEELGGVLEAWEDRARSAAWSSRGNLILILIVIIALVAGALYVIVCVGFGWLDALLIPDGCVNLGDEICVGLTQRTAFLTVIFLTLAGVIFLVLRILLRGYNSNIFWRDDARERIAFATVYINMLGNARTSQKTDDYARIVYETLFRPANSKLPLEDVSVGLSIPDNLAKNLIKQ